MPDGQESFFADSGRPARRRPGAGRGVLVWISFPHATSDDDLAHRVTMAGGAAFIVGPQYEDVLFSSNAPRNLWLRKGDLASGSLRNIQTSQCRELFSGVPSIARGSAVVADGTHVYLAGDYR